MHPKQTTPQQWPTVLSAVDDAAYHAIFSPINPRHPHPLVAAPAVDLLAAVYPLVDPLRGDHQEKGIIIIIIIRQYLHRCPYVIDCISTQYELYTDWQSLFLIV